mgnify:CR=1 FL=1
MENQSNKMKVTIAVLIIVWMMLGNIIFAYSNSPNLNGELYNMARNQNNSTYIFETTGTYDMDGEIQDYEWNFGDGCLGIGETVIHSYVQSETYCVTLYVTDDDGDTSQMEVCISVSLSTKD